MFAIIRPHRIDFSGIQNFPASSWDKLLKEIGAVRAPGGVGHDQRVLVAGDEAFVFLWAAPTGQLKEILRHFGITAYTEDDVRFRRASNLQYHPPRKTARHQCHIYGGPASRGLTMMAAALMRRLIEGYRCLYLNSPAITADMASYLSAAGTDVERQVKKGSLLLSSDQGHLADGDFEIDRMMDSLEDAVIQASSDGYKGLWAAGDMSWEFGPLENFDKLLTYESHLEDLFARQPGLNGVCQYHAPTLPREALHYGLISHSSLFVNEVLSRVNPLYFRTESLSEIAAADRVKLDDFIAELCLIDRHSPH
jgi:MEDS: MEthanogen/methylotroph, DcmR Sensory domain